MPAKILIAEDFDDLRSLMSFSIRRLGHEVLEAANGREATEQAAAQHPDLILMDLSMPVVDGITAARRIRTIPELSAVPIIAVTCYNQTFREAAIEAGCDDVVNKDVFIENIAGLLVKYLGPE